MTWPVVALAGVCDLKYGKALPAQSRVDGPYAVYGSNGRVGQHSTPITEGATIIVGRKGSVGEVHYSADSCWPIDTTYYIDQTSTEANLRWLAYRLGGLGLTRMNKAAAVPGLNRDDAYRLRLRLPPIEEQRRIADILDRADALRVKRREALTLLDDLTQSIFLDMFGDTLGEADSLADVVAEGTIVTYGIVQAGDEFPGGVPYIRTGDLVGGEISTKGLRHTDPVTASRFARSRVAAGDIVMSIRATVGTTALLPPELDGANLTQGTARIAPGKRVTREYLLEYLRSPAVQQWIARQVKGATFREITLARLRQLPVNVPDWADQLVFVERWRATQSAKRALRRESRLLDELFASLQQRAFAGEL